MRIKLFFLLSFFFVIPIQIQAVDLNISCEEVSWIEIRKTPSQIPIQIEGFRGDCSGVDCFLICIHLTNKGFINFYNKLSSSIGDTPNIYIDNTLIFFGITINFVPPIEFYRNYKGVDDLYIFSKYEDAKKRAFDICPGKQVKYTGIMGEKQ